MNFQGATLLFLKCLYGEVQYDNPRNYWMIREMASESRMIEVNLSRVFQCSGVENVFVIPMVIGLNTTDKFGVVWVDAFLQSQFVN